MEEREFDNPIVTEFKSNFSNFNSLEIQNICYDIWTLKITLALAEKEEPIYIIFKDVFGFRVLDEGELLEFWRTSKRKKGWIFQVEKGGWFSLEKLRKGFVSGHFETPDDKQEYLLISNNDCVSVISYSEPEIMSG